jgi:DNA-binding LytR/AlgR family response regulator
MLANDLARLARRERRTPIVYIITHAECHVPLDTIERLRVIARLYGVFMLPSQGELELDYLHRLHTVQVVDEAALKKRDERAKVALDIVEDAAKEDERAKVASASEEGSEDGENPFPGRSSWV